MKITQICEENPLRMAKEILFVFDEGLSRHFYNMRPVTGGSYRIFGEEYEERYLLVSLTGFAHRWLFTEGASIFSGKMDHSPDLDVYASRSPKTSSHIEIISEQCISDRAEIEKHDNDRIRTYSYLFLVENDDE